MNRIFRIYEIGSLNASAVGYLIDENETRYFIRVQEDKRHYDKEFSKSNYYVKSIYESASQETYRIHTKNTKGENISIDMSKACFGGCG